MSTLKGAITADPHVGVQLWGKINPATGLNTMVEKFIDELKKTVVRIVENDAKFWIIAGDLTHTRTPPNHIRDAWAEVIQYATDRGLQVYALLGNHDKLISLGTKNNFSDLARLQIKNFRLIEESELIEFNGLQMVFLPWQPSTEKIVSDSRTLIKSLDDTKPAIVVGHFSVDGAEVGAEKIFELHGSKTVPIDAIVDKKVQYTFLGHIHKKQFLRKGKVAYIGSMERIDFSERNDVKGSLVFQVDLKTKEYDFNFVDGTPQKFVQIELNLLEKDDLTFSSIPQDIENAVVKLRIRCTHEQKRKIDFNLLESKLSKAMYIVPIAWDIERDGIERKHDDEMTTDIDEVSALRKWLNKQDISDELKESIVKEGQKLLQEDFV